MKRFVALALTVVLAFALVGCGSANTGEPAQKDNQAESNSGGTEPVKVAVVMSGPISDGSWNAAAYQGLMEAKGKYGIEPAYIENVAQADAEGAFRDYADQGYDLIIGHGAQFTDPVKKVAPNYPDVKFVVLNSDIAQEPNVGSIRFRATEIAFVTGAVAGLMTKTGKVGIIGGLEIPVITEAVHGFLAGAKYANPNVETTYAYVGDWNDVAKAKELAITMMDSGVDVIQNNANQAGLGIIEAAKARPGVMVIGNVTDQNKLAPDTVLTSGLQKIPVLVDFAVSQVVNGKWEAKNYKLGLKEGAVDLAPWHGFESKVPQDVKDRIQEIKENIINGKLSDVVPQS
ncbi:MAG TPA: BMP family ABC transporter substrate-binding protein [Clostridia bacterium]|nr:BMP family ABC transporter substrate-binding protein [Clostridia bacterium]